MLYLKANTQKTLISVTIVNLAPINFKLFPERQNSHFDSLLQYIQKVFEKYCYLFSLLKTLKI